MQLNQLLYIIPQELQAFTNEIDDVLLSMTHNAASNTVMLGTTANGIAYNTMAQQLGYTYFYSVNFTALEAMYSKRRHGLYQQIVPARTNRCGENNCFFT